MTVPAYELKGTLLQMQHVNLILNHTPILRDVNLEIQDYHRPGLTQGRVIGLLGPSGVGKTCLFRILAGLDAPTSGSVLLADGSPVERGKVGVVAQDYPLFAHRTVLGNLLVAGNSAGLSASAAKTKASELLDRFNLSDHTNMYPAQLSGGQRQRIAIAQQFMCSEHFLLMDEPFSGLDPLAVTRVCDFITEMAASDELQTFIVVTHDIPSALAVSDTIWVLGRDHDAEGKIIPGARIQATFNLIERGVAWHQCTATAPECIKLQQEIRELFPKL